MTHEDIDRVAEEFRAHLGDARGEVVVRGELRWQHFASGGLVVAGPRGPFVVYGEIARRYQACGGPAGGLGAPVTHELDAGDGVGRYNDFERGSVYWSPTTGAHEVHGNIGMQWVAEGRCTGRLGYPVTDELARPGGGAYQFFQRGALRWTHDRGVQPGPFRDRLYGWADTHAHPAAHLGFGGGLISGQVEGPPEQALADCSRDHGVAGTGLLHLGRSDVPPAVAATLVSPAAGAVLGVGDDVLHGGTLAALEESLGHRTEGWPKFDGWPRFSSRVHQQMYLEWVERAYRHGQRLMVALANHSNLLALGGGNDAHQRDWEAGLTQLAYVRDLAARTPWMEVVRTPQEAREAIERDHLALVLGVELDTLGGLEQPARDFVADAAPVSDAELDAIVQTLWDADVRYVFPVHLTDNAFGAMALYRQEFIMASWAEGRPVAESPRPDLAFGRVNAQGLFDAGRRLLTRLAGRGMLVDVDHLSWQATDEAFVHLPGYPLVSGHATFHELAVPGTDADAGGSDESRKRPETLRELARRGSFVGVQPVAQPLGPHPVADAGVTADCPGSSTQFARAYRYAVAMTGGRVAIGTDLNGFAAACGPRFGPGAAPGLADEDGRRLVEQVQRGGVRYRTPVQHAVPGRLEHPHHMWSQRRREALFCLHLAEAGEPAPLDLDPFNLDLPATVEGFGADREPSHPPARAAYRAYHGLGAGDLRGADRELHDDLAWVVSRHREAGGGPNPPLERCTTGGHDWDYNLEGLAHYGLVPDLLHDLGNLGLAWDSDLMPLLTSAETVVSTWERCHDQGAWSAPFTPREADRRTLAPAVESVVQPRVKLPRPTPRLG